MTSEEFESKKHLVSLHKGRKPLWQSIVRGDENDIEENDNDIGKYIGKSMHTDVST